MINAIFFCSALDKNKRFVFYILQMSFICFDEGLDLLIEYRLNKAGNDLLSTNDSITDIAYRNGFESSAYFGKMFRKHFQMTPSQFRKTAGSQTDLDEPELDEIVEAAALVSEENEKIETAAGRL